ncbi:MAG: cobalamin B12-binding domain-containing protein [Rubricella sp.]
MEDLKLDFDVATDPPGADMRQDGMGPANRSFISSVLGGVIAAQRTESTRPRIRIEVDIRQCCMVLCDASPDEAVAYFERLIRRGLTIEHLFEDTFGRISGRLGEKWSCDQISFVDVAFAYSNLQIVLHRLKPLYIGSRDAANDRRAIAIATLPGETHVFGMLVVAAQLERRGFDVTTFGGLTADELIAALARAPVTAIGLSCGTNTRLSDLEDIVGRLHMSLTGRPIIVGGMVTALHGPDALGVPVARWGGSVSDIVSFLEAGSAKELHNVDSS